MARLNKMFPSATKNERGGEKLENTHVPIAEVTYVFYVSLILQIPLVDRLYLDI